ncbi:hypothetical protein FBY03_12712 [Pseudomonas sp. SJZ079]|nr:hypothetical protein FBY03_12712 [Pseudomonas sp. SJZ079]
MLSEFRTSAIVATLIAVVLIILLLSVLIRVLMQPLIVMGKAMQDMAQGEGRRGSDQAPAGPVQR